MYNEIQRAGLNGALHKTLSMKEGAPAPILATEISPGLTLESDRPEWGFLKGEYRWIANAEFPAGVAANIRWLLQNPANSGAIAVVEGITWVADLVTTTPVRLRINKPRAAQLATVQSVVATDSRALTATLLAPVPLVLTAQSVAGSNGGVVIASLHAAQKQVFFLLNSPVILGPDSELGLEVAIANGTNCCPIFWGYIRAMESSEAF